MTAPDPAESRATGGLGTAGRFSERLLRERLARGLSLRELARGIDGAVSHSYLALLERGKRRPPKLEVVLRLAAALGITPQDLGWQVYHEQLLDDPDLDALLRALGVDPRDCVWEIRTHDGLPLAQLDLGSGTGTVTVLGTANAESTGQEAHAASHLDTRLGITDCPQ